MRIMLLAAVLLIAACDSQPPKTAVDVNQIIRFTDEAMHVTRKISAGAPAADVHAAMERMNVGLNAAHAQIEAVARRISVAEYHGRGSIDPLDLSLCIDPVVTYAPMLERMQSEMRVLWHARTFECVSKATNYFETVSGADAAAVALAMSVLEPILMVAEVQAGMPAESRLQNYRSNSQAILAKFASECGAQPAGTEQMSYECAAYEVAKSVEPKLATFAAELPAPPGVQ
jgi:hypothetical protein